MRGKHKTYKPPNSGVALFTDWLEAQSLVFRFLEKVIPDPATGCWLWHGSRGHSNRKLRYGSFGWAGRGYPAHRVSWWLYRGDPGKAHICHNCDNPGCVNPDHMFLGLAKDNHQDKAQKGRAARKLTPDQVRAIRADPRPTTQICKDYPVNQGTISHIKIGRIWAWLD